MNLDGCLSVPNVVQSEKGGIAWPFIFSGMLIIPGKITRHATIVLIAENTMPLNSCSECTLLECIQIYQKNSNAYTLDVANLLGYVEIHHLCNEKLDNSYSTVMVQVQQNLASEEVLVTQNFPLFCMFLPNRKSL